MTQDDPGPAAPVEQPADPERSGADVVEAVETAAAGTPHGGVQTSPAQMKPHAAPVEQVRGDEAMTEGQVTAGAGTGGTAGLGDAATTPSNPSPAEAGSGGAQSIVGARVSDRLSAGEEPPGNPPFSDDALSDRDAS